MRLYKRLLTFLAIRSSAVAYHFSFDVEVMVGTTTVSIPIIRGMGLEHLFGSEEGVRRVIGHVLARSSGTFVDIGANIGQTLVKVAGCDKHRRYLGFELQPSCIGYLARLIDINHLRDFHIFPFGLSSRMSLGHLSIGGEADPGASLVPELRDRPYSISFPVILEPGDEIFRLLAEKVIAMVKIDVEGAEWQVLIGMKETLARYEPILLLEILPTEFLCGTHPLSEQVMEMVSQRRQGIAAIRRLTQSLGYRSFRILPSGRVEANDEFEMPVYDGALTNYLFLTERHVPIFTDIIAT